MNILVIGSGGREHALVWKLSQSKRVSKIFCAPGNPGIGQIATLIHIPADDISQLIKFAETTQIDLTIVGPEVPLVEGIVDTFEKQNLRIIGPNKQAAQIEGSKGFAKKLMKKYGIPTAKFEVLHDLSQAKEYLKFHPTPLVIKADGLCAGKGVAICQSLEEAEAFLEELFIGKKFGTSGQVIIEEYLEGPEVSFMIATDGIDYVSLLPSQDHKRIFDNDKGQNTGGMGAYTPVPFVDNSQIRIIELTIIEPILKAMEAEGSLYKGILYPGLIITPHGPKVLEFNCRFGDPETQSLMTLLETDILDVFDAIGESFAEKLSLRWKSGCAVTVILAAPGYPEKPIFGQEILGLEKSYPNVQIFHAGTKQFGDKVLTSGGRVLAVTGTGKSLIDARHSVYEAIGEHGIHFEGMQYRKDIGAKAL